MFLIRGSYGFKCVRCPEGIRHRSDTKDNGKITAAGFIICHRNVGIMCPGNDTAEIKPKACTLFFPGGLIPYAVEPVEYFFLLEKPIPGKD